MLGGQTCAAATEELTSLCRNNDDVNPSDVRRLVKEGADFFSQCPGRFMPILHHFTLKGMIECVKACLASSASIEFTITNNKWEKTVFHCVCEENNVETAKILLELLLERLESHSTDHFDWEQEDLEERNFISSVAHYQQLAALWPVIATTRYYTSVMSLERQIPIRLAWEHDWQALGESARHFTISGSLIRANKHTRELAALCKSREFPDPLFVRACVKNGADIGFVHPDLYRKSLLDYFISNGLVECVAACLSTPSPIDFTAGDEWGWTPLHLVCVKRNSAETARSILQLIVRRIELHPNDKVSWGKVSEDGYDFISCAAKYQKLSAVWPVVRDMPFYADMLTPLNLTGGLWLYDWEELGKEQESFCLVGEIIQADRCTAELVRCCEVHEWTPSAERVTTFVREGSDVCFLAPDMNKPILHHFIFTGQVECVYACLQTKSRIDFTVAAEFGWTVLHYLCVHNPPATASAIFSHILARLNHNPGDIIDWAAKDDDGNDFISYAGYYQKLSVLWPLAREVPYFTVSENQCIHLRLPVLEEDFSTLGGEQSKFVLHKGFSKKRRGIEE